MVLACEEFGCITPREGRRRGVDSCLVPEQQRSLAPRAMASSSITKKRSIVCSSEQSSSRRGEKTFHVACGIVQLNIEEDTVAVHAYSAS